MPLATLRTVTGDSDRSRGLCLCCSVAFRSYYAYRIFVQLGFADVATLLGGSETFRAWHEVAPDTDGPIEPETSYAEAAKTLNSARVAAHVADGTGVSVNLERTGLACPGPIMKLATEVKGINLGDEIVVHISDPSFASDAPAWVRRNDHELLAIEPEGPGNVAIVRKAAPATPRVSFVGFSGDIDTVIAAVIIANAAISMGEEVSMFFTVWGLNALRQQKPAKRQRKAVDKLFAGMIPAGSGKLTLSPMHMMGAGTAMIKKTMRKNAVHSLPELMESAMAGGARVIGCTTTMDLRSIAESDLIEGVELGGVATFSGEAAEYTTTLFI